MCGNVRVTVAGRFHPHRLTGQCDHQGRSQMDEAGQQQGPVPTPHGPESVKREPAGEVVGQEGFFGRSATATRQPVERLHHLRRGEDHRPARPKQHRQERGQVHG